MACNSADWVRGLARFVVYGMNELLSYAADLAEIEPFWWRLQHDSPRAGFDLVHEVVVLDYDEYSMLGQAVHRPTKQGGQASLRFVNGRTARDRESMPACWSTRSENRRTSATMAKTAAAPSRADVSQARALTGLLRGAVISSTGSAGGGVSAPSNSATN